METVGLEKHELPPTNQKRMVAFINHFVLSTVNFLNRFASDCESKFIAYEHKMQSLEASLLIVEAKLASIEALKRTATVPQETSETTAKTDTVQTSSENRQVPEEVDESQQQPQQDIAPERDPQYDKYFKMVQVGVPVPAVKNKIASEGLDPGYIDQFL